MTFPFPFFPVGTSQIAFTYVGSTSLTTNLTTYTFTSHAIGTASADRLVLVGVVGYRTGTAASRQVTGITIGGNAAMMASNPSASNNNPVGIGALVVAAGATADIAVTFSDGMLGCAVFVATLKDYQSATPHDTDGQLVAGTPTDATLDIPAGGIAFAVHGHNNTNAPTWTGATQLDNQAVESTLYAACASHEAASLLSGHLVRAAWGGGNSGGIACASWR